MLRIILVSLVLSTIIVVDSQQRQPYTKKYLRSYVITPRNQTQVTALSNFLNNVSPEYYFGSGKVMENRSHKILVPVQSERRFLSEMSTKSLHPNVEYDRVKMKFYGDPQSSDNQSQSIREIPLRARPAHKTHVTYYDKTNYRGYTSALTNIEDYSYIYFTFFNDRARSYQIHQGSCVISCEHGSATEPPSGRCVHATQSMPSTSLDRQISTVMRCGVQHKSGTCPSGTFVKSIEWDDSNSLTRGIKIGCYKPDSKKPYSTVQIYGQSGFSGRKEDCTALRGLEFSYLTTQQYYYRLTPLCKESQSDLDKFACGKKEAMTGLSATIENNSNVMKSTSVHCKEVGNIEELCAAHDEIHTLFTCDASGAVAPFKCTYQKSVGISISKSLSEGQSNEYEFHTEFGFEVGASGFGLSTNFQSSLGTSTTTGYNWEQSQSSTWTEEITLTLEIEAPPKCKTIVYEVVGDCSFMTVRPQHFIRNDTCVTGSIVTQIEIPEDFREKIFFSPIPDVLKNQTAAGYWPVSRRLNEPYIVVESQPDSESPGNVNRNRNNQSLE